jgi:phospholipid-transporting ATPase
MSNREFEVNVQHDRKNKERRFRDNSISTGIYTWYSFLPKNLFMQFSKLANFYFLLMLVLEVIPSISDTDGQPVLIVPLGFVVGVSMIKDIVEDWARHN